MCKGISILKARIKQELFDEYELEKRVRSRGDETQEELHFLYPGAPPIELPVIHNGRMAIYE